MSRSLSTTVSAIIARARAAQAIYAQYSQEQVDEVVTATAWSIINHTNNVALATMAVNDTGLGNIADKISKNKRKTMGLLRDLKGVKTVGIVAEYPEKGLIEIARPVGIVGAIVPSTNPAATPTNKTLNALKGGNAIVLAPSPKGANTCARLVELMQTELKRVGAPLHLVQALPAPISKESTLQLMQKVDLVVATGSQNNVRAAYSCGTPAIGVGAGNVVSIVDETADLPAAAQKIVTSKAFDNATSCSSENNLIVIDSIYDALMRALSQNGAVMLSQADRAQLAAQLWHGGKLNQSLIAKKAYEMAALAKLKASVSSTSKVLLVQSTGIGKNHPYSGEKLSPVLTVYKAQDFAEAKAIAAEIMAYQGQGHSISIHSNDEARPIDLGLTLPICRVIVNQIHCYATGGSFDNALPFSLSMGCGTWGKNSISDNMNYTHYLNTTRIVRTIPPNEPSVADLFADYWETHGIAPQTV